MPSMPRIAFAADTATARRTSPSASLRKLVFGCALALSASASFAATQINVGTVVWIGYGPFYVAEAMDMYKKYNLSVRLQVFNDPALIPAALAGGSVQGTMVTYDQVIGQVAKSIAKKILVPVEKPILTQGKLFSVTASIGIAFLMTNNSDKSCLVMRANDASGGWRLQSGKQRLRKRQPGIERYQRQGNGGHDIAHRAGAVAAANKVRDIKGKSREGGEAAENAGGQEGAHLK